MIITECYKDKALVHRIGFSGEYVWHEFGRSRVLGKVEQSKTPVVGIIDEDPNAAKPPEMKEYIFQEESTETVKLLKRKNDDTKRLIQICPRLENWLYMVARRNKVSPSQFGLPGNPEELHTLSFRSSENFHKFLIVLNRAKDYEIDILKKWIKETIV